MKTGILSLILSIAFVITANAQMDMKGMKGMKMPQEEKKAEQKRQSPPASKKQQEASYYTCVMHPEIHSDKPGNCPKCGMKLVKKTVAAKPSAQEKQPSAPQNGAAGKEDMGGMKMPMNGSNSAQQPITYTCVMHPEIHSSKPGNCPKCGMKLVKEKPKAASGNDGMEGINMNSDTAKESSNGMEGMDMDGMSGMDMGDNEANIALAKKNLGPIKTYKAKYPPRTVRYDLHIRDTMVNYSGKKVKRAIAVNGQIPMPTLTFTEGDTADIWVYNDLDEVTALHWHGLFLPNKMDGVPYLTQMPIKAHSTYHYKYPIVQHGTHWYHSHSGLQEQIGMYGAFIMKKREEWDIPTIPIVLSDWIDMRPKEVNRSLHNQTDWFGIRKNTIQSYSEAIKSGHFKTKVQNEWKRMLAMDVSDVAYDVFLINGKNQSTLSQFKAGDKVRLRIANGGASSYFWLSYAGGKITVVATDGNDVEPVEVDRLLVAVSETYDVVVTIPENKSYEFLVTPEDRTKSASLWLGGGQKVPAEKLPTLKYFAGMRMMNDMMDMNGNMKEMEGMQMANQTMDMNTVMYPEITGYENADKTKGSQGENGSEASGMNGMNMNHERSNDADTSMHMKEMTEADRTKEDDMKAMKKQAPNGKMQMGGTSMDGMDMGNTATDIVTLNYAMLKALEKTTLRSGPLKTLSFELTGNMNRYVWSLDNKVVSEADKILIKRGENVRIILYNNTMMRHPMHLHGHDFRLLNGQGEYAVMKNIIDIMPMERDTIEFAATEPGGDWFFHCHILYHMMSGMGRVFSYQDTLTDKTDITSAKLAKRRLNSDDRHFHSMARIGIESNGSDGMAMLSNTRYTIAETWHLGIHPEHGYESETIVGRYLGKMQWWRVFVGYDYHYKMVGTGGEEIRIGPVAKNIFGSDEYNWFGQQSNKNNRSTVTAGVQYLLPMNVLSELRADLDGKFRFQLSREDIPVSPRIRANFMLNTDKEYALGLRYIITKYFNVSTHYDSDMGLGAGITISY